MHLEDIIAKLRSLNEPVPKPARLPTESEVAAAEKKLGIEFPSDYHQFLLQAGDVTYGTVEPAMVTPGAGHLDLVILILPSIIFVAAVCDWQKRASSFY